MNIRFLLAALAIVVLSQASVAQRPSGAERPSYTPSEQALIDRNAALAKIVDSNPELVRRAIDAIEAAQADSGTRSSPPPSRKNGRRTKVERAPDPKHNPDLDQFGRMSPEAAHDLFQLIKNASKPTNKRLEH
jgi:hypothetical protein